MVYFRWLIVSSQCLAPSRSSPLCAKQPHTASQVRLPFSVARQASCSTWRLSPFSCFSLPPCMHYPLRFFLPLALSSRPRLVPESLLTPPNECSCSTRTFHAPHAPPHLPPLPFHPPTTLPATLPREIHATQRNEKEEKYGVFDDDDAAHQ